MSVIGAKVISKLSRIRTNVKWGDYLKNILIISLIAYVFVDLTKESHTIISNFKPWPMQEGLVKWDDNFEYYDFYERFNLTNEEITYLDANYFKSFEHIDTLSNKGTKNRVLDPMGISGKLGNSGVSSKGEPEYRGEYYFMEPGTGNVKREKWSPNKIKLKAIAEKEGVLVINQNFHKQWKVKEGFEIVNFDGLLGIKIPKGEHEVNLYVFQNKIIIGGFLSLVGLISGIYLTLKINKTKNE